MPKLPNPVEIDFEEYIRHIEPSKQEKGFAWAIAIGLQQVDGLTILVPPTLLPFTNVYFKIYINLQENYGTTILQKKNGF